MLQSTIWAVVGWQEPHRVHRTSDWIHHCLRLPSVGNVSEAVCRRNKNCQNGILSSVYSRSCMNPLMQQSHQIYTELLVSVNGLTWHYWITISLLFFALDQVVGKEESCLQAVIVVMDGRMKSINLKKFWADSDPISTVSCKQQQIFCLILLSRSSFMYMVLRVQRASQFHCSMLLNYAQQYQACKGWIWWNGGFRLLTSS